MLSWLSNYPIDVIKTRFQADNLHKTYWELIQKTYQENGLRSFFIGLGSTLIRFNFLIKIRYFLGHFQQMRQHFLLLNGLIA